MREALRGDVLRGLVAEGDAEAQEALRALRENSQTMLAALDSLRTRSVPLHIHAAIQAQEAPARAYVELARKLGTDAQKQKVAVSFALPDLSAAHADLGRLMKETQEAIRAQAREDQTASDFTLTRATTMTVLLTLAFGALLFAAARGMAAHVGDPVVASAGAMRRVSLGDLGASFEDSTRKDELGDLLRSIRDMHTYLREVAGVAEQVSQGDLTTDHKPRSEADLLGNALRRMSANLRRMIGETREGSLRLAAASDQIESAARKSLTGVHSQAAAIHETTASAGELIETVRVTEERAKEIQHAMTSTVEASQEIRGQLGDVTRVMATIETEMTTLLEALQGLASRNLQIGEISESVSELADQSQLLAINAGIEAAKAGEFGRGFSVVAGEMRSLSDGSKRAAQHIRGIVQQIETTAHDTRRVIDQSQQTFRQAVRPVSLVLDKVEKLTVKVEESGNLLRQILAIVGQQAVGVEQITQSMWTIQTVVNDGVEQNKDLERAAADLSALSRKFQASIAGYRLSAASRPVTRRDEGDSSL